MYCIWQIILIVCSTILTIPVRTGVFYSAATDITVSKYGHITLPVLKLSALLFPVPITSRLRLTFVQMCSVGQLKHWRTVFGNGEIIPSHFIKMFRTMFWFLICMEAVAYSQIFYSEMGPWSVFFFWLLVEINICGSHHVTLCIVGYSFKQSLQSSVNSTDFSSVLVPQL